MVRRNLPPVHSQTKTIYSTDTLRLARPDCALALPVAPPGHPPPDLHIDLLAQHDALAARQAEGDAVCERVLEVRAGWGTAKSIRELKLRGYGGRSTVLDFCWRLWMPERFWKAPVYV